jgi:hypothetical protein
MPRLIVPVIEVMMLVLRPRGESKVHQMRDRGLTLPGIHRSHGMCLVHDVLVNQSWPFLLFVLFPEGLVPATLRGLTRESGRPSAPRAQ